MSHASVRLVASTGAVATLVPGDLIGRMWSAALFLDDPRVSEAHAMVSLRGDRLELLSLRGALTCDGMPATRVRLANGRRIGLVERLYLDVESVTCPAVALVLTGLAGGDVQLRASVYSLLPGSCRRSRRGRRRGSGPPRTGGDTGKKGPPPRPSTRAGEGRSPGSTSASSRCRWRRWACGTPCGMPGRISRSSPGMTWSTCSPTASRRWCSSVACPAKKREDGPVLRNCPRAKSAREPDSPTRSVHLNQLAHVGELVLQEALHPHAHRHDR